MLRNKYDRTISVAGIKRRLTRKDFSRETFRRKIENFNKNKIHQLRGNIGSKVTRAPRNILLR